jgi:hypothetical protein
MRKKTIEVWKTIEGYEGFYEVSNLGRVKSVERVVITSRGSRHYKEKQLCQIKHGEYLHVLLCKNGVSDWFEIHQLVAKAFIPNPNNYAVVHHINRNPQDNRVENLMWVSKEEHDIIHTQILGGKRRKAKRVDQIDKITGEVLHQWNSPTEAALELGYDQGTISKCCSEKYLAFKTYKNFIWKYCLL